MPHFLRPYLQPLLLLGLCCVVSFLLFFFVGYHKSPAEWDWVDIIGEGGAAFFVLIWMLLMIKSRPCGRVTNYLFYGLSFIFFHMWMDTLDEFIKIPQEMIWDAWLESIPFPIGLLLLTVGIFFWHQEQLAISKQMQKRERIFRDHRLFDALTPLADANYFKNQLDLTIKSIKQNQDSVCVILLDMKDFNAINQKHGFDEGTAILLYLSQVISLNLRPHDLLCRFAGDRFVLMLPETHITQAAQLARQLEQVIAYSAYYHRQNAIRIPLQARTATLAVEQDTAQQVIRQLYQQLNQSKQQQPQTEALI